MTVSTTTNLPVDLDVGLLLLPFTDSHTSPFVEALSDTLGSAIERTLQGFEAEEGQARVLCPEQTVAPRVALLGLGPASGLDTRAPRTAVAAEADVALEHEADTMACPTPAGEDPGDKRTAQALAELEVSSNVVGLLPATDNRPGRRACMPGDVARMHPGTTVEVMNPNAEGRLLPADALSCTDEHDPELAVDLAALTGSCTVASGQAAAGAMATKPTPLPSASTPFSEPVSGRASGFIRCVMARDCT
ncbi:MAG: M17 family peptidase N-terminal domain-containing protein [Salinibacter sp.]|uniref:M17 family peptidase N-terminal domain-containing protein n=1 Tax=Salinibacter sp. TaxID=2065818 RepID=UPI0035D457BA